MRIAAAEWASWWPDSWTAAPLGRPHGQHRSTRRFSPFTLGKDLARERAWRLGATGLGSCCPDLFGEIAPASPCWPERIRTWWRCSSW